MLSQLFFVSPTAFVVGIGTVRQPRAFLTMTVRDTGRSDSELRQALQRLRRAPGTWEAYIRLPVRDYSLQLLFFDRVLTWPLDQPRHATKIFNSSGRFQVAPGMPPLSPTSPAKTTPSPLPIPFLARISHFSKRVPPRQSFTRRISHDDRTSKGCKILSIHDLDRSIQSNPIHGSIEL
jgi:hypothetical protein